MYIICTKVEICLTFIFAFISVGHCHPHVVSCGQEQMARLQTSTGFLSDNLAVYTKRLIETLPDKLCVCYFLNSGWVQLTIPGVQCDCNSKPYHTCTISLPWNMLIDGWTINLQSWISHENTFVFLQLGNMSYLLPPENNVFSIKIFIKVCNFSTYIGTLICTKIYAQLNSCTMNCFISRVN